MSPTVALLLLLGGMAILVAGGELLVRGAVWLARLMRVPGAIIGLTIVALATSLPELAVSLSAALHGSPDAAVGNVIGSNIFNLGAMVGLAALVVPLPVHRSAVLFEWPVMLAATVLTVGVAWDGHIGRGDGLVFLVALVVFHAFIIYRTERGLTPESAQEFEEAAGPGVALARIPPWVAITALVAGGAAMLALGGHLMVEGGIELARLAGVSERVIGLTVLAAGTSLPELAASLMAALRNQLDIALANAMGSNIFNLLGILGATALIRPVPVSPGFLHADVWWMLGFTVLIAPLMYTGRRITRPEGALLLVAYVGYVALLVTAR